MRHTEILEHLRAPHGDALLARARAVRDRTFGREIFQRGVIEFSNHCRKDCHYCGLRVSNDTLSRFALTEAKILQAARTALAAGMGTVVLQAGEYLVDRQAVARLIGNLKALGDLAVTLSLGDHDADSYALWRDAGADRYLLKMETFDQSLHSRLRPGQTVRARLRRVETLLRLGYATGSGIISGLPGMTDLVLAEDLLRLAALPLDMIAIGPFVAHPRTPLAMCSNGSMAEALRATAIMRLLRPTANIPATSALDALAADGRLQGLAAGANVVMPSVTPEPVRAGYSIYPGKNASPETVSATINRLQERLRHAGYHPSSARGDAPGGPVVEKYNV